MSITLSLKAFCLYCTIKFVRMLEHSFSTKLILITASGRGSVLPSISYKDFTGKDLLYRENTDLASYEDLKILSSWPSYRIF